MSDIPHPVSQIDGAGGRPGPDGFEVRLARGTDEIEAAMRLRYEVFVAELGGTGPLVDHAARLERDRFDAICDHMILIDRARRDGAGVGGIVGVYRLLPGRRLDSPEAFYTAGEYDLSPLWESGRPLLELGRSCLHRDYRGGAAMHHLWSGLAEYALGHGLEVLFGVASFHGTDPARLAHPLSLLHHVHRVPPDLRVRARKASALGMALLPPEAVDRVAAMRAMPALIKAYLRLGGGVGEGAFVDHAFNTTDVCLILDTARLNPRQRAIYTRGRGA